MDLPAVEKSFTHISTHRPSESSESDVATEHSPTSSWSHHDFNPSDRDAKALAPISTRATARPPLSRELSRLTTTLTQDPGFEVDFQESDPDNPRNWPMWYKCWTIFTISFGTLVVVLYSTSYTSAIGAMQREFNVQSEAIVTLGVTTYLVGLAVGSLLLAPISETYGRKPVYCVAMALFVILIIPCARAQSITTIIIVRFFGAMAGSAMVANAPGSIGDIISDRYRATAFSIWSIGPMNGPVIGPTVGGFVTEYCGWRWANWVVMIAAGVALMMVCCIKETYEPALLQAKAKKIRKETNDDRYWCRYDVRVSFTKLMKVNLSRPFIMAVTEPICIFWNVYIAIIYGILYLCFVAYPIVFTELRGWSIGFSGLSFLGIGIGTMITICSAGLIRRMIDMHKQDPNTGIIPPESMMSVVCIAAVLIPVGELWFAWSCYPIKIHWAVSIAAGIPFGCGNAGVFIYATSYLVHSYGIYAASALAGNAVMRSFLGGTLPLAGPSMYRALGPNWAGTLLGLLEVMIIPIPFVFYKYGGRIREKSALIREMRENEERQERKKARAQERLEGGKGTIKDVARVQGIHEEIVQRVVTSDLGAQAEQSTTAGPGKEKVGWALGLNTESEPESPGVTKEEMEANAAKEMTRFLGIRNETIQDAMREGENPKARDMV